MRANWAHERRANEKRGCHKKRKSRKPFPIVRASEIKQRKEKRRLVIKSGTRERKNPWVKKKTGKHGQERPATRQRKKKIHKKNAKNGRGSKKPRGGGKLQQFTEGGSGGI